MGKVLIVGGGIAGLAAAYELHRRGVPFVLLEAGSRVGGVILSEQIDGYTIDAGPDSLLVQKPDGIKLCEELGLGDRLVPTMPPRLAYIQRGGVLHALPAASVLGIPTRAGPFVRTRLFSWSAKLRMAAEYFIPPRRDEGDESIGAFMRRRFGDEAVEYLAEPLLAGIHAGDVERLSVRALFPRLVEAERTDGSLLRAFRRQQAASLRTAAGATEQGVFRSLPGGLSEMVCALVRALPPDSIKLNTPVAALDSYHAAAIVLATPAYVTADMLRPADAELATLCGEIRYASTATVVFGFRRDAVRHPLNGSGFVVPRVERTGILAASWLSSKWPGRAPEGHVLLRTFVGGARDPDALERSDAELVEVSLKALRPLLGLTASPTLTRVYRWTRASAQHEVGHLARLASIERALLRHPGLFITGSGFRGVGIPDCIADGRATGREVSAWLQTTSIG